ncbi:MSHA biogenesis protein MshQ [Shewanella corallii]|uniref:MSHA biogenesis protein MshQ n=1 Tax=Shewanella corallii TaxID=560080 RepID=A0ABT0N1M2_9GAMM|nr:DUF6701 domain-containing protein [Shewanella corallii]MCL2912255.1 MSHA biogenesis protein MshQ [Shewanella corallii]
MPAWALPLCEDVFTEPPQGNQGLNTLQPPSGILAPPLSNFTCNNNATCDFPQGDTDYNNATFSNGSKLTTNGPTTRLYLNSLSLINADINVDGDPEDLFIYVAGSLSVSGQNDINAIIYVNGSVSFSGNASLNGALASGGALQVTGNTDVDIDIGSLDDAQISDVCASAFDLQFGSTSQRTVTFARAYPTGVTPLVFLMPTIDAVSPASDGPASLFLTSVSGTGFSFEQRQPSGSDFGAETMTNVSWIAVTPGTHTLPNGDVLQAGSVITNRWLRRNNGSYETVNLASGLDVALHQLQSRNNNCWLTSTSLLSNQSIRLSMDMSQVYSSRRCQPGNIDQNNLANETIAYLALDSGSGNMTIHGESINYQFANFNIGNNSQLSQQCAFSSSLTGFSSPPVLVAGKTSRNSSEGGWLRRCRLSNSAVSMVIDEDQFRDSERNHTRLETYSVAAFEVDDSDPLKCFGDSFSSGNISDDWEITKLGNSVSPSIVGGRLRITEDIGDQANSLTFQKLFPAADNLVVVEFDYYAWSEFSGTGADGVTVIFSDGTVDPRPGSFGGSLGYAQRNNGDPGFAGGWIGVGLDEWGNFSNPTEGRIGGPGFRRQAIAIRGSEASGYRYLAGTAAGLSPAIDVRGTNTAQPNHRYRVKLDSRTAGSTIVSVERDTRNGAGYVELVAPFDAQAIGGQGVVPEDFMLSLTGSTGGAYNNHEIDFFEVCAIKANDFGGNVDHFEISYSSSPLTCTPEVMTIRACADASCSQLVTDPVTGTLSLSDSSIANWVGGSGFNLVNGSAQISLQGLSTSAVTIGVERSNPAADNPVLCSRGGATPTAAQCQLSFSDSGFLIDVPDKLAGQPVTANITAVRSSDDALVCTPAFASVSKDIEFWSSYNSPAAPVPVGAQPQVALFGNDIGRTQGTASSITASFNAQGQAQLTLDYPDAGSVNLNASYSGAVGDDDEGLTFTGSGSFISAPAGLCVSPESSCSAADGTCPVFKRAGDTFKLTVSGRAWVAADDGDLCNNPVTPNYAHAGIQLGSQLVAPVGGATGAIGLTTYNHSVAVTGEQELDQSISEVGVFRFSATPAADYLGSSSAVADIPAAVSEPVGRFVPAEFLLSTVSLTPSCGSGGAAFSYMGQEFSVSFTATARNLQQAQTQNFVSSASASANFANATALFAAENADSGVDLAARLSAVPSLSWVNGVATVTGHAVSFNRPTAPGIDGPFVSLDTGIIIQDGDGLAEMANPDMDAGGSGICSGSACTSVRLGSQQVLFGRLAMDNVYGPESALLQMPLRAEYWSGSSWATNLLDSCTAQGSGISGFNPALLSAVDDSNGYSYDPDLGTGQAITRSGSGTLVQGQSSLRWQSTGSTLYRGWIQAPLASPSWLKFYWNWDGSSPTQAQDPRSSAYFGTFRGHDKKLHWREQ